MERSGQMLEASLPAGVMELVVRSTWGRREVCLLPKTMVMPRSGCSQGLFVGIWSYISKGLCWYPCLVKCHADSSGLGCLSGPHSGPRTVLSLWLYWSGWSFPSPGAMVTARFRLLLMTISVFMAPTATEVYVDVHVPMVPPRATWNLGSGLHLWHCCCPGTMLLSEPSWSACQELTLGERMSR